MCRIHIVTASLTLLPYLAYVLPNTVSLNKNEDGNKEYGAAAAADVGAGALPPAAPPAAPSAGAAAAAVGGPSAVPQAGGPVGIPVNCGIRGVGAVGQQQVGIAAAGAVVSQAGLRSRNPCQALLMAQMNHDLNQRMVQMRAFMPTESERQQTCIKSAITSVYARLAVSKAQGRSTAMIEQQIDRLGLQLNAILNAL
jgi:hypothetical protein